jgi:hypothetical protein
LADDTDGAVATAWLEDKHHDQRIVAELPVAGPARSAERRRVKVSLGTPVA